jgi:hypothetical protein
MILKHANMIHRIKYLVLLLLMFHYHPITQFSVHAQDLNPYYYETGNPILKKIYVNPTSGNDNNSGNAPNQAFRTINRAWNMIPMNQQLQNSGYLIQLASGSYGDVSTLLGIEERNCILSYNH